MEASERGAKVSRNVLNQILGVVSTVALITAVVIAPIRSTWAFGRATLSEKLRCDLANSPSGSSHQRGTAKPALSSLVRVKAISEKADEDERVGEAGSSFCKFVLPPAVSFEPSQALAPSGLIPSVRPLRC
jgi:hypothetical protein